MVLVWVESLLKVESAWQSLKWCLHFWHQFLKQHSSCMTCPLLRHKKHHPLTCNILLLSSSRTTFIHSSGGWFLCSNNRMVSVFLWYYILSWQQCSNCCFIRHLPAVSFQLSVPDSTPSRSQVESNHPWFPLPRSVSTFNSSGKHWLIWTTAINAPNDHSYHPQCSCVQLKRRLRATMLPAEETCLTFSYKFKYLSIIFCLLPNLFVEISTAYSR